MAAQVHCIGCLETGADFPSEAYGLQMRWSLERSEDWQLLEGAGEGTSQIHMSKGADPLCTFDHPLDVRLHCDALAKAAAPRIKVEIYQLDELDRLDIAGYGMVHLPLSTGTHSLVRSGARTVPLVPNHSAMSWCFCTPSLMLRSSQRKPASRRDGAAAKARRARGWPGGGVWQVPLAPAAARH